MCVFLFVVVLVFVWLCLFWLNSCFKLACLIYCSYSPNSACARGSGGVVCFDCCCAPPAVANFRPPSGPPWAPAAFLNEIKQWPILRLRRGGRAASSFWNANLCCDGFMCAASRCQLNWQAELAHRTSALVVFRGPQKMFFRQTCLFGFSWPPVCLPAELAGRACTQTLRSRGLLCSPKKCSFSELVWLASVDPQFVCQQNSQAELAHRTCAPVASRVAP